MIDSILYLTKYHGHNPMCIPNAFIEHILHAYHYSEMLAYPSRDRLYQFLRTRFYWKGMYTDTSAWVNSCLSCQSKNNQPLRNGLLVPIPTTRPFEIISKDHLKKLKKGINIS